jgi:hypothetical protein
VLAAGIVAYLLPVGWAISSLNEIDKGVFDPLPAVAAGHQETLRFDS